MLREANVQRSNQVDGRFYPAPLGIYGVQRAVSEIFVDMPDTLGAPLGGDAEQGGACTAEAACGQPACRDELVASSARQAHALDDERTSRALDLEPQTVDLLLFQALLAREPARHPGSVQHLQQRITE